MTKGNKFRRIYYYFKYELEVNNFDSIVKLYLHDENDGLDILFTTTDEVLGFRSNVEDAYKILYGVIRSIKNGTFYEYY